MRMLLWRVTSGLSLFSCVLSFLVFFYLWLLLQRHRLKHFVNKDYLWSWRLLQPLEFLVYFFNLFIFCDVFILDIFGHFLLFSLTNEFDSPNTDSTEAHLECIRQALSLTWLHVCLLDCHTYANNSTWTWIPVEAIKTTTTPTCHNCGGNFFLNCSDLLACFAP